MNYAELKKAYEESMQKCSELKKEIEDKDLRIEHLTELLIKRNKMLCNRQLFTAYKKLGLHLAVLFHYVAGIGWRLPRNSVRSQTILLIGKKIAVNLHRGTAILFPVILLKVPCTVILQFSIIHQPTASHFRFPKMFFHPRQVLLQKQEYSQKQKLFQLKISFRLL